MLTDRNISFFNGKYKIYLIKYIKLILNIDSPVNCNVILDIEGGKMLYKIGEFSRVINLPVKTLRYYDEIDLFKPEEIDLFTGYRYYSKNQIEDIKLIKLLKEAGFSLEEIKNNWDNFTNEAMLKKREELLRDTKIIEEKIRKLDYLRSNIVDNRIILDNKIKPIKIKKIR